MALADVIPFVRKFDDETAKALRDRFEYAKSARKSWERQTKMNLAFLSGLQWLDDRQPAPDIFVDVRDLPAPTWRVRIVDNRILGIYQGLLGRLMAQSLSPSVQPVGPDPQNTLAARAASRILRHIYSLEGDDGALGLEHQLTELYGWLIAVGKVYLYGYWDPSAWAETPQAGAQQIGDVRTLVLSPLEVFSDPSAKRFHEAHWAFRTVVRNIDEVKLLWPETTKKLEPESLRPEIPLPNGSASASRSGLWLQPQTLRDAVLLKEYFERPSQRFPQGRYAIYVGGEKPTVLRYEEQLPYAHGRIPIREMGFIRIPGANNPMGVIDQLRDPQKYLNEIRSKRIEHVRLMAAGKWIVDRTANVDKNSITSEPGEVIFKDPTGAVGHVPMTPLPEDVQVEVSELEQSIQNIAQLKTMGVTAPGGGKATAVEAMIQREIEDLARAPFFAEVKSVLQRFGKDCLELARERYIEPRLFKFGSGLDAEVDAFQGADLYGAWEVKVDLNTQGPMSRSERIQIGMQWLQLGAFGPAGEEKTLERFFQFTGMGASIPAPPSSTDSEIAEMENAGMRRGLQFEVGMLDNHEIHLERHIPAMKRLFIDPSTPQSLLTAMQGHIQTHMMHFQREQAQQAQAQGPPQQSAASPGTHPHGPTVGEGPGHPGAPPTAPPEGGE